MKAFVYVAIFVVLIAGTMIVGNVFLKGKSDGTDTFQTPTPTQAAEVTPTPIPGEISLTPSTTGTPSSTRGTVTPTPTQAAKKNITVRVLNGSGESGAAGDGADVVLAAGYIVSGTGNADTFDYDETVIQIKKSKQTEAANLRKALAASYTVATTVETLAETATVDAIVIVGSE